MSVCKKCGAILPAGSRFCGRCGTTVDQVVVQICPVCKNRVPDGFVFCNNCGKRLPLPTVDYKSEGIGKKTLVVSRDSQLQCMGNTYEIIVNGNSLGKVPVGGAVRGTVSSDTATVEIICTSIMIKARRMLVLRLGENPRISFKVQWPGTILETVHGAQVLERR